MRRLAIVEDDAEYRATLVSLFAPCDNIVLGPVAGTAEELLAALPEAERVDIVLVDLGLPRLKGSDLIERLVALYPGVACVAHTVLEDPKAVFACLRAGAAGYLLKGCSGTDLVHAIRTLDEGGAPLTPRIARMLLGEYREAKSPLSEREVEVLGLLSRGYSYKEVAAQLVVSSHTIHTHVKNLYNKLQVGGRRDAVDKARRKGWLKG